MTNPTTTAQTTVSSTRMPLAEEQLNHALETLADIAAGKLGAYYVAEVAQHIDALTEQVRVLRELLHNAMAYIPNEYDDELALRNSIADALAALEGSGEQP